MTIDRFKGEHRFLSNFYPAEMTVGGVIYPTVEHAFQAAKTLDEDDRLNIAEAATPGAAKRLGRRVKLRRGWDEMRVGVMRGLLELKFSTEPLRSQLLDTGAEELMEGNHWGDTFWGVDLKNFLGQNILGKLLMDIRDDL